MSATTIITLALLLIGAGIVMRVWSHVRRKRSLTQLVSTSPANAPFVDQLRALLAANPDLLPALPSDPLEFEGWFEEAIKQVNLRVTRGTRAQHIALWKQLVEYRTEHLKLIQTTKAIGHEIGLADLEHEAKRSHLQREIEENAAKIRDLKGQSNLPKAQTLRDPVEEELVKIRRTLRTVVGIEAECEQLVKDFPAHEALIRRECRKIIADLRERS